MMLGSGSDEQEVARLERFPLAIVNENTTTANDDVDLILPVRCLLVRRHRERELYVKGATLQNEHRALAGGTRDTLLSIGKANHTATVCLIHVLLSVPLNADLSGRIISAAKRRREMVPSNVATLVRPPNR